MVKLGFINQANESSLCDPSLPCLKVLITPLSKPSLGMISRKELDVLSQCQNVGVWGVLLLLFFCLVGVLFF